MEKELFAVIGGDLRMVYAAEALENKGYPVFTYATAIPTDMDVDTLSEALILADIVLLPLPMSRDGIYLYMPSAKTPIPLSEIFAHARGDALLLGGGTGAFSDKRLLDYGRREELALKGAVPTAEGALALAIEHCPCTVSGSEVAVMGFGRVGKATAALFRAAGASVTVFARREETVAVASLLGYHAAHIEELPEYIGEFRCLVNTVPSPIVGDKALLMARRDLLLLELASQPYGIELSLAKSLGLHAIAAGGLPGKYSPETAGNAVADTVLSLLKERHI